MPTSATEQSASRPPLPKVAGWLLLGCLLAVFAQGSSLHAQGPTTTAHWQALPLDSSEDLPRALRRPVTVRLSDASLEDVLHAIARQAELGISYSGELVRSRTRVDLDVRRVSAAHAINAAVRGTGWQVLYTGSTAVTLVVVPDPSATRAPTVLRGSIAGPDGRPLQGVTVMVEAAGRRAVTDEQGEYVFEGLEPGTYTVTASALGYTPAARRSTVPRGSTTRADLRLAAAVVELDELIAIGYGVARRRDLTGSITSVRASELPPEAAPSSAVSGALLGRVPGLQVASHSGVPGASARIHIRGINSIAASPDPLYVIDGIPIAHGEDVATGTPLSTIDPKNIESVQILKDASATAIYGSRGANGVVLITTRRGVRGENSITLESSYGVQRPTKFIPVLRAAEYRALVNEGLINAGRSPRFTDSEIEEAPDFDYPRALLQDLEWQPQQSHSLTISGGDSQSRYMVAGSLLRQEGIVINSGFSRAGARVNFDRDVTRRFRIGTSLSGTRSLQRVNGAESTSTGGASTGITAAMMYDPAVLPRDAATGEWNQRIVLSENFLNPYTESLHRRSPELTTALLSSLYAEFDVLEGLLLRSTSGGNFNFGREQSYSPSFIGSGNDEGTAAATSSERRELTSEATLTYRTRLGPGTVEAMAGGSVQTSRFEQFTAGARGFPDDQLGFHDLDGGATTVAPSSSTTGWVLLSYLGRVNYNLLDRYLFTVTARRDGSSRFGTNNKWALFPSAAFAWRVIDEPILEEQSLLSDLKFRISYGRTGNQAINPYQSLAQLMPVFLGGATSTDLVAFAPTVAAGNPSLRWERQDQYNLGADLGFLDNRITITVDAYQSVTRDLLLNTMVPWTSGFSTQLRNVGAVRNRGVELGVNTVNWEGDRFAWRSSLNVSRSLNEVSELYGGLRSLGAGSSTQVGEPLNTFVGYRVLGLYQAGDPCPILDTRECAPGEYRLQDSNGDRVINDSDRVNLGSPQADFYGGFASSMSYGPLSLDAFFNFSVGNEINNTSLRYIGLVGGASNERRDRALRRWTPQNTDTDVPRANVSRPNNRTYSTYVEDGSFLRLQTLTAAVQVPPALLPGADAAQLVVTGQNLWVTTPYSGYDPELQVVDAGGYPRALSWNIGLELAL